jgi:inhibitor of nuclear factor kappa-B kinase subunit alpha
MKSKDIQKLVSSKYKDGEGPTKIFRDLNGAVCLRTIKQWCKMLRDTGSIELFSPPGRPRIVRTKGTITKVKNRLQQKRPISTRKLAKEFGISRTSMQRILRSDLGLRPYKKIREPMLTDEHKDKCKKFANWIRTNFRKEETMKILFSDEKLFDIDGVYNSQNDRVWAVNRAEADEQGGIKQTRKFPQKVMVWLGVCSKGVSPLVIFENGTVDHSRYIQEVLPVALEYGNKVFRNQLTFQQDGAKPHVHHLTQQWCRDNFPSFIDNDHWPPNSPDLNPLDYSIWDEFVHAIEWDKVTSKKTLTNN